MKKIIDKYADPCGQVFTQLAQCADCVTQSAVKIL